MPTSLAMHQHDAAQIQDLLASLERQRQISRATLPRPDVRPHLLDVILTVRTWPRCENTVAHPRPPNYYVTGRNTPRCLGLSETSWEIVTVNYISTMDLGVCTNSQSAQVAARPGQLDLARCECLQRTSNQGNPQWAPKWPWRHPDSTTWPPAA